MKDEARENLLNDYALGLGGSGSPDAVTVEWDNVSASIVGLR